MVNEVLEVKKMKQSLFPSNPILLVDDEPKLRIYERGQANPLGVTTYRVEDYESLYDSEMASPELDAPMLGET